MGILAKRLQAAVVESEEGDCGCGCNGAGDCEDTITESYVFSSESKRLEWMEMRLQKLLEDTQRR